MEKMTVTFEVISGGGGTRMPDFSDVTVKKAMQAFLQELALDQSELQKHSGSKLSLQNMHWTKHEATMHLDMATHIRETRPQFKGRHIPENEGGTFPYKTVESQVADFVRIDPSQLRIGTPIAFTRARNEDYHDVISDRDCFLLHGVRHRLRSKMRGSDGSIIHTGMFVSKVEPFMRSAALSPEWIKEKSA